jgi:predicted HAD superfamily Cof-like phosphohydrolase
MMQLGINRESLVEEFHEAFGHPINDIYADLGQWLFRLKLIKEELAELENAIHNEGMEQVYKELADLQYVVSGMAVAFGIDLEASFLRVHKSNMSKLGEDGKPIYREDGKILKGPNYKEPNLLDLVP